MKCRNCCSKIMNSKCWIYTNFILTILMNIFILVILLLITYDIILLNFLQASYLIVSILVWISLLLYSFYKFFMIILGRALDQTFLRKIWKIVNYPAYIIILIGVIYDLIAVTPKMGVEWLLLYFLPFLFICIIFTIISILDLLGIKQQVEMVKNKAKKQTLYEEEEMKDINKNND